MIALMYKKPIDADKAAALYNGDIDMRHKFNRWNKPTVADLQKRADYYTCVIEQKATHAERQPYFSMRAKLRKQIRKMQEAQ